MVPPIYIILQYIEKSTVGKQYLANVRAENIFFTWLMVKLMIKCTKKTIINVDNNTALDDKKRHNY